MKEKEMLNKKFKNIQVIEVAPEYSKNPKIIQEVKNVPIEKVENVINALLLNYNTQRFLVKSV